MLTLSPVTTEHVASIAHLHITHLQTSFRGYPGAKLLECYYRTVISFDGGCGYCMEYKNEVIGYVCGIWDSQQIRKRLLQQHFIELLFWGAFQLLIYPKFLLRILHRMIRIDNNFNENESRTRQIYELRPIVVIPEYRGTGAAKKLVQRLILDARARGFDEIILYTERDNYAANAFYQKIGFKYVSANQVGQTLYYCYLISTSDDISNWGEFEI